MSVLIKDMAMPKDGVYWCEIGVAGDIATITIHGEDRKSFPLIEVPESHGRLVDADAPISLVDTRGEKVEVTVAHIIEKNRGIVKSVIPASWVE